MVGILIIAQIVVGCICFVIFYGMAAARFWLLRKRNHRISWHSSEGLCSIIILMSMVVAAPAYGISSWQAIAQIRYGVAYYAGNTDNPSKVIVIVLKGLFINSLLYLSVLWLVKASFLVVYYDVRQHLPHTMDRLLNFVTFFIAATYITNVVICLSWCRPMSVIWSPERKRCHPIQSVTVVMVTTISNIVTDIMIMLIGYLVIRSLPLRRGAVWAAAFVFSLGTLTIVTAIIRCVILLHSIDGGGSISLMKYTFLLSQIESTVAGVAACLPAFRVFLRASSVASTAGGPGSSGNREAKQSSINELSLATIGGTGGRRQAHSADSDLEDLGGSDIDLVYPDHRTSGPTSTMV